MFDNIKNMIMGTLNSVTGNSGNNDNMLFKPRNNSRSSNRCLYKLISFDQSKDMIEKNQVKLIDVRTAGEYDLMHIKNAINIPVDEIEQKILQIPQDSDIMIYCSSGSRSKTAIQYLNKLGYSSIYIWEYAALANFPYKNMLVYGENGKIV